MTPAAGAGAVTINASSHQAKEAKEDGTPTDAVERLHLPVQRAPCRARSPIGVPPRFSPEGLLIPKAQLQARLPGTWVQRALPAVACPSPVEAPHGPVIVPVSMMPGAARAQQ